MTLREFAKGQDCQLRIYGQCCYEPKTVVLCHIRKGHIAGMKQKPPDIIGVFGCHKCHAVIDGRIKTEYTKVQIEAMMLHGMARTLAIVDKHYELVERDYPKK